MLALLLFIKLFFVYYKKQKSTAKHKRFFQKILQTQILFIHAAGYIFSK